MSFSIFPTIFSGATLSAAGRKGLVPTPIAGQNNSFLRGDGTWSDGLPLDVKGSVKATTTANITLSGAQTIDGVSVVAGDRVLVKNQTLGENNGIYVAAAGAWSRSTDADTSEEVTSGMYCWVDQGTGNADSGWILTTNDPIVLGTTPLVFTQFSGAGMIVAGNNISKSGNTISTTTRLLEGDGSAGAPSYSFTGDTGTGWYYASAGNIGFASVGAAAFTINAGAINHVSTSSVTFAGGAVTLGALSGQNINFLTGGAGGVLANCNITFGTSGSVLNGTTGSIGLTATGTNQSITLTPSGTGGVALSGTGSATLGLLRLPATSTIAGGIMLGADVAIYRQSSGGALAIDSPGATTMRLNWREQSNTVFEAVTSAGVMTMGTTTAAAWDMRYNSTAVLSLTSVTNARINGTKTLSFGATANATIGVSADTTAGDLQATLPTTGRFVVVGATNVAVVAQAAGTATNTAEFDFIDVGGTKSRWLYNFGSNTLSSRQNSIDWITVSGSQDVVFANTVTIPGTLTGPSSGNWQINRTGTGKTLFQSNSASAPIGFEFSEPTANTQTSATHVAFQITPFYNQASGSAANTDFLINRSQTAVGSGAQLLIDAQIGGVSKFKVDNAGKITAGTISGADFSTTGPLTFGTTAGADNRSRIYGATTDGVILLTNNAATDFTRLQFGGTTSSFPAIKRATTTLLFRLADDSADASIFAAGVNASADISTTAVGRTLFIKSGSNAKAGTFTLTAGAATVSNTSVTANSVILFSVKTPSGALGLTEVTAISAGTSFTVSGAATDNGTYNYVILEVN